MRVDRRYLSPLAAQRPARPSRLAIALIIAARVVLVACVIGGGVGALIARVAIAFVIGAVVGALLALVVGRPAPVSTPAHRSSSHRYFQRSHYSLSSAPGQHACRFVEAAAGGPQARPAAAPWAFIISLL